MGKFEDFMALIWEMIKTSGEDFGKVTLNIDKFLFTWTSESSLLLFATNASLSL